MFGRFGRSAPVQRVVISRHVGGIAGRTLLNALRNHCAGRPLCPLCVSCAATRAAAPDSPVFTQVIEVLRFSARFVPWQIPVNFGKSLNETTLFELSAIVFAPVVSSELFD